MTTHKTNLGRARAEQDAIEKFGKHRYGLGVLNFINAAIYLVSHKYQVPIGLLANLKSSKFHPLPVARYELVKILRKNIVVRMTNANNSDRVAYFFRLAASFNDSHPHRDEWKQLSYPVLAVLLGATSHTAFVHMMRNESNIIESAKKAAADWAEEGRLVTEEEVRQVIDMIPFWPEPILP